MDCILSATPLFRKCLAVHRLEKVYNRVYVFWKIAAATSMETGRLAIEGAARGQTYATVSLFRGSRVKGFLCLLSVGALLCASFAQERDGTAAMNVLLDQEVSVRSSQVGDKFTTVLMVDMKSGDRIIIPKGARFGGHVSLVIPSSKDHKLAEVGLAFDSLAVGEGQAYPIGATIQALALPAEEDDNRSLSEFPMTPGSSSGRDTGSIASEGTKGPSSRNADMPDSSHPANFHAGQRLMPANTTGVFGTHDVALKTGGPDQGTLVVSAKKPVRLPKGSQLLI